MLLHPKLTKRLIICLQICLICSITVICFLFVLYLTSEKNQVKEFFVENLSKQEKDRMQDLTTRLAKVSSQQQDSAARLYDPQIDNYETLENMENRDEATMDTIYIDDYAQEYQKFGEPSERSRYEVAKSEDSDDRNTIIRNFNAQNDNVALLENIENIDKIEYFDRIIVDHGDTNTNNNKLRDNLEQGEAPVVYTTKTLKPTKKSKDKKRQKSKRVQNQLNRYLTDNESDDGEFSGSGDDMEAFDDIDSYTVAKSKKWHRQLNRLNRQKQANRFRMEGKPKTYYKTYTSVEDDDEREAHVEQVFKERIAKQKHRTKSPSLTSKSINTNVVVTADSWVKSSTTTTTAASPSSSAVPQVAAATLKSDGTFETRARRIKSNVEKSEEKARKLLLCEESGNYGELCRMLFKGDMSNN